MVGYVYWLEKWPHGGWCIKRALVRCSSLICTSNENCENIIYTKCFTHSTDFICILQNHKTNHKSFCILAIRAFWCTYRQACRLCHQNAIVCFFFGFIGFSVSRIEHCIGYFFRFRVMRTKEKEKHKLVFVWVKYNFKMWNFSQASIWYVLNRHMTQLLHTIWLCFFPNVQMHIHPKISFLWFMASVWS